MREMPTIDQIQNANAMFDRARLDRLEKSALANSSDRPRYNVEPALGELVTIVGQELVSSSRP